MPENSSGQQKCHCDHILFVELGVFSVRISYSIFIDTLENISQTLRISSVNSTTMIYSLISFQNLFQCALNPCFILPCKFPGENCFGIEPTHKALLVKTETEF